MAKFFVLVVGLLSFCALVSGVSKAPKGCFRAAALDHVQQRVDKPDNPTEDKLREEIDLNLKVYEKAASTAKDNVSDL